MYGYGVQPYERSDLRLIAISHDYSRPDRGARVPDPGNEKKYHCRCLA